MRRIITILVAGMIMSIGLVGTAQAQPGSQGVAPAAAQNGVCEAGEVCLFFNSNCQGSLSDFNSWIEDFAGYRFLSAGNGRGQLVKNNAASARNRFAGWVARIHFNSGYKGSWDDVRPGSPTSCRQLANTYNENASLSWYPA